MALNTEGEQYIVTSENYFLHQHVKNYHKLPLVTELSAFDESQKLLSTTVSASHLVQSHFYFHI